MVISTLEIVCLHCESNEFVTTYSGPLRAGIFGKLTESIFDVVTCCKCGLTRNKNFPEIDYSSSNYRQDYNNASDIDNYLKLHKSEQVPRLSKIGIEKFRNKTVLDYGCRGGAFLDAVKEVASCTLGIEPYSEFHKSIQERGHEVYSDVKEAEEYKGKVDIVVTFGVIEHVDNSLSFLKDIHEFLSDNGTAFIETDNLNDVLMYFNTPEFNRFFYRTAHYWYFDANSLKNLCQKAGFTNVKPGFQHGYNLANTLLWLKDREPNGNQQLSFISPMLDAAWRSSLEESGLAELLFFEVRK